MKIKIMKIRKNWEKETSVMLRGEDRKVGNKLPHLVHSVEIGSNREKRK